MRLDQIWMLASLIRVVFRLHAFDFGKMRKRATEPIAHWCIEEMEDDGMQATAVSKVLVI
jgi:hypothetical protein